MNAPVAPRRGAAPPPPPPVEAQQTLFEYILETIQTHAGYQDDPAQDEQTALDGVLKAIDALPEAEWNAFDAEAKAWYNSGITAIEAHQSIPVPEGFYDSAPAEAAPAEAAPPPPPPPAPVAGRRTAAPPPAASDAAPAATGRGLNPGLAAYQQKKREEKAAAAAGQPVANGALNGHAPAAASRRGAAPPPAAAPVAASRRGAAPPPAAAPVAPATTPGRRTVAPPPPPPAATEGRATRDADATQDIRLEAIYNPSLDKAGLIAYSASKGYNYADASIGAQLSNVRGITRQFYEAGFLSPEYVKILQEHRAV